MTFQEDGTVRENRGIRGDYLRLELDAPLIAAAAAPGQFVHVRVPNMEHRVLRRPFSLCDADPKAGLLCIVYKVVGDGTRRLSRLSPGAVLDLIGPLGLGFTGYLLPWNQRSYWATAVGSSILGTIPLIGDFLVRVMRGGDDLTFLTLSRFYGVHIWFLPASLFALIGIHLYLVVRNGISWVPKRGE